MEGIPDGNGRASPDESSMIDPPGEIPWFDPVLDPVSRFQGTLPVRVGPDGTPVLPGVVLWALSLNPGDLLAVEPQEGSAACLALASYGRRVWSAFRTYVDPWPRVRDLLRLPLAAVGPKGALGLPDEAANLLAPQPGERLLLECGETSLGSGLRLKRPEGDPAEPDFLLEASYAVPLEPGPQVTLPPEVLWALSLAEGDLLTCRTVWLEARYRRATPEKLAGLPVIRIGPGGTIPVPAKALDTAPLKPPRRLTLTAHLFNRPSFHLDQSAGFRLIPLFDP